MRVNNIKRILAAALAVAVIMAMAVPAYAVQPRYAEIYSIDCSVDINNNIAECFVKVIGIRSDYTYTVRMMLYQDDQDYDWWDGSGLDVVNMTRTCYVTRGYDYYVGVHVKVYDTNGNLVEQAIAYSETYEYH